MGMVKETGDLFRERELRNELAQMDMDSPDIGLIASKVGIEKASEFLDSLIQSGCK